MFTTSPVRQRSTAVIDFRVESVINFWSAVSWAMMVRKVVRVSRVLLLVLVSEDYNSRQPYKYIHRTDIEDVGSRDIGLRRGYMVGCISSGMYRRRNA